MSFSLDYPIHRNLLIEFEVLFKYLAFSISSYTKNHTKFYGTVLDALAHGAEKPTWLTLVTDKVGFIHHHACHHCFSSLVSIRLIIIVTLQAGRRSIFCFCSACRFPRQCLDSTTCSKVQQLGLLPSTRTRSYILASRYLRT